MILFSFKIHLAKHFIFVVKLNMNWSNCYKQACLLAKPKHVFLFVIRNIYRQNLHKLDHLLFVPVVPADSTINCILEKVTQVLGNVIVTRYQGLPLPLTFTSLSPIPVPEMMLTFSSFPCQGCSDKKKGKVKPFCRLILCWQTAWVFSPDWSAWLFSVS